AFPDDFYTTEDATTPTGLRVTLTGAEVPWVDTVPVGFRGVFDHLSTLDGFGTTAGGFLRFTQPLDLDAFPDPLESAEPGSPIFMAYEDTDGSLIRVPVDWLVR